jgi:hypothetical protein
MAEEIRVNMDFEPRSYRAISGAVTDAISELETYWSTQSEKEKDAGKSASNGITDECADDAATAQKALEGGRKVVFHNLLTKSAHG